MIFSDFYTMKEDKFVIQPKLSEKRCYKVFRTFVQTRLVLGLV